MYLDVRCAQGESGTSVGLYHATYNVNQKWRLQRALCPVTGRGMTTQDGKDIYIIASALDENLILSVEGDRINNDANLVIYRRNDKFDSQHWTLNEYADGSFSIISVATGKALQDIGDRWHVNMWEYDTNKKCQKWKVVEDFIDVDVDANDNDGVTVLEMGNM